MTSASPTPIRADLETDIDDVEPDFDQPSEESADGEAAPTDDGEASKKPRGDEQVVVDQAVARPEPTASPVPASTKTGRERLRRTLKAFVALSILGGLAAAAYLAWPSINERYIAPVETTAADLSAVENRLDATELELVGLAGTADELSTRTSDLAGRLDTVEATQVTNGERLDDLDDLIAGQTTRIDDLGTLARALGDDLAATNGAAARQLGVTRAAELMSRARLFLYQANYGLAADDIAAASEILTALDGAESDQVLIDVIDRLDKTLLSLPALPVAAAADLDIAWQQLLASGPTVTPPSDGLPESADGPTSEDITD